MSRDADAEVCEDGGHEEGEVNEGRWFAVPRQVA